MDAWRLWFTMLLWPFYATVTVVEFIFHRLVASIVMEVTKVKEAIKEFFLGCGWCAWEFKRIFLKTFHSVQPVIPVGADQPTHPCPWCLKCSKDAASVVPPWTLFIMVSYPSLLRLFCQLMCTMQPGPLWYLILHALYQMSSCFCPLWWTLLQ